MTSLESSPQEPRQGTHMGGRAGPMAHDVVQGLVENAVGTHGEHGTSTGTPDDAGPRQVVDTGETLDSDRKVPTTPRVLLRLLLLCFVWNSYSCIDHAQPVIATACYP